MAQQLDPGIFQTALLQVAEATQAAAKAAQSASAAASSAASSSAAGGQTRQPTTVDWSKLVNKPPVFDFPNQEQDHRNFRDWLWQLNQYLICVDEGFSKELSQITEEPAKSLDIDSAPLEVRQRSAKLYGLLAGLVKNRALSIVRAAPAGNGFEALRQLVLSMRPNTQARGLSLLASVTAWPSFSMGKPLQAQLLKLEDAYEETRRAGTTLGDELKCAILLRCLSGALKTHLSLSLKENSTYLELREEILRWDRAHQKWSNLVSATDETSDVKPMEIDRIQGKGKTGDKGKGKSDKGGQKGKSKQKGKDKGKSKNSNDKSGYSGKGKSAQNPGKGKGKGERVCYVCGKPGHLAKDCWSSVRNVQAASSVGGSGQSEWTNLTSVSQQGAGSQAVHQGPQQAPQQQTQQATQYRVSRISEFAEMNSSTDGHEHFVCDLRESPMTSPTSQSGSVRAIHYYIGDEAESDPHEGEVRAVVTEIPSDAGDMCHILLDSGADAAVFPTRFAQCGDDPGEGSARLHDAQGNVIPVETVRDVEIRLLDETGRMVLLKERVAISPHVTQPILCYGRLLQAGWGMDSREQVLTHEAGIKIPIELQNMSVTVKDWVRVMKQEQDDQAKQAVSEVRAVKADVSPSVRLGPIGWHLDSSNCGVGRHHSDRYQDPTLVRPEMSGRMFRTTLLRDMGQWYVLELCEPFETLVDMNAEIYGYDGPRNLLTIITDSEKEPAMMGFSLLGDDEIALFPDVERQEPGDIRIAPDDEVLGREMDEDVEIPQGADVPLEGRLVFAPSPTDMVLVNGVELTPDSNLQSLRTALTFYGLSTSGSKSRCFTRLLNHQKQQELEIIQAATEQYKLDEARRPKAVDLKVPPSEEEQEIHNLTHLPYAPWCPSCVCFRARADKQQRSDGARRAGVATISFDFCYTKSVPEAMLEKDVDTMVCLVMCDSSTGYLHAVPLRSKNQWNLMVRELLGFAGIVGHSELVFMCDNEPTLLQLQRMTVNARLSMGLPTRKTNPPPYSHGNSLVENAVGRIRPLAGTLIHFLSEQVGMEFSTNSPFWSWAFRHACFLLNRFNPTRGATAYELLYNKAYGGKVCNFGEPVFGFANVSGKGTARWRRMIFLGKSDPQDTYLLFDGHGLVLTRSIRRISTVWKGHLPFYMNFQCWSWEYKTGFGGRIVPTRAQKGALSASFTGPVGEIEPSAFFDEEAEAVKQKHLEEVREETEITEMTLHDKQPQEILPALDGGPEPGEVPKFPNPTGIWDIGPDDEAHQVNMEGSQQPVGSAAASSSSAAVGMDVPQTPDVFAKAPTTPRHSSTTRQHDAEVEEDHEAKRAKVETAKKQRLERISAEYSSMVRAVKFADETFYTMDEYEHDLQMDEHENVNAWIEEEKEKRYFTGWYAQ